jgi:hypothetical protein
MLGNSLRVFVFCGGDTSSFRERRESSNWSGELESDDMVLLFSWQDLERPAECCVIQKYWVWGLLTVLAG